MFFSHCPRSRLEFDLPGRVRPSGRASAWSFLTFRLNPVLTHGLLSFLPFSVTASSCTSNLLLDSPELIMSVRQVLRTDGVHHLEVTERGPIFLTVACVIGAACSGTSINQTVYCVRFSHVHWVAQKRSNLLQSTRPRQLSTVFLEKYSSIYIGDLRWDVLSL